MGLSDDEKALALIERGVYYAKEKLEASQSFRSFVVLLNEAGDEIFEESAFDDEAKGYEALEAFVQKRIERGDIEVLILVAKSKLPPSLESSVDDSIRVHLEERSQIDKKIGARFLYIPYEQKRENNGYAIALYSPLPIGFPAQYIIK
jgi:hypothetical protein